MRRRLRITQHQFDSALRTYLSHQPEGLRHGERSTEVARQVLVNGMPQADVARQHQLSRQRVSDIVNRFRELLADDKNVIPVGWIRDAVTLPAAYWPRVRAIEQQAVQELVRTDAAPSAKLKATKLKARRHRRPPD
jgi:hypothetical protein